MKITDLMILHTNKGLTVPKIHCLVERRKINANVANQINILGWGRFDNHGNLVQYRNMKTGSVCSKEALVQHVDYFYKKRKDLFGDLTELDVVDIKDRLMSERYKFSPVRLTSVLNLKKPSSFIPNFKFRCYRPDYKDVFKDSLCLVGTQEDELVLMALGNMILVCIHKNYPISENSYGFRHPVQSFYDDVCSRGAVNTLYKIDVTSSLISANRSQFLIQLLDIIKDSCVMELVIEFINICIIDTNGNKVEVLNSLFHQLAI